MKVIQYPESGQNNNRPRGLHRRIKRAVRPKLPRELHQAVKDELILARIADLRSSGLVRKISALAVAKIAFRYHLSRHNAIDPFR